MTNSVTLRLVGLLWCGLLVHSHGIVACYSTQERMNMYRNGLVHQLMKSGIRSISFEDLAQWKLSDQFAFDIIDQIYKSKQNSQPGWSLSYGTNSTNSKNLKINSFHF